MQELAGVFERRTTTDVVFDQLHEEIVSLEVLPGTKLSEADVARRFGVSRQPVRDAFARLENLDLLLIRPQKATEVRGFSMQRIAHARIVRLAVELDPWTNTVPMGGRSPSKSRMRYRPLAAAVRSVSANVARSATPKSGRATWITMMPISLISSAF